MIISTDQILHDFCTLQYSLNNERNREVIIEFFVYLMKGGGMNKFLMPSDKIRFFALLAISFFLIVLMSADSVDAYNFALSSLEYRDYTDDSRDHTRVAWILENSAGEVVPAESISNLQIMKSGEASPIEWYNPWQGEVYSIYGEYNTSLNEFTYSSELATEYYYRVFIAASENLSDDPYFPNPHAPPGNYQLSMDTNEGPLSTNLPFGGPASLPRIDAKSIQLNRDAEGGLLVRWELPDSSSMGEDYIQRLALLNEVDGRYGLYLDLSKYMDYAIIPPEILALFPELESIALEIRSQTEDKTNRVYSDQVVAQLSDISPVPEPATMLLLGFGLVGLVALGRKKFFKK